MSDANEINNRLEHGMCGSAEAIPTFLFNLSAEDRFRTALDRETELGGDYQCTVSDVVCGSNGNARRENQRCVPGNVRFRIVVLMHLDRYRAATSKGDKSAIVREIVEVMRKCGGKFVREENGVWYDIGNLKAREKASSAVRHMMTASKQKSKSKVKTQLCSLLDCGMSDLNSANALEEQDVKIKDIERIEDVTPLNVFGSNEQLSKSSFCQKSQYLPSVEYSEATLHRSVSEGAIQRFPYQAMTVSLSDPDDEVKDIERIEDMAPLHIFDSDEQLPKSNFCLKSQDMASNLHRSFSEGAIQGYPIQATTPKNGHAIYAIHRSTDGSTPYRTCSDGVIHAYPFPTMASENERSFSGNHDLGSQLSHRVEVSSTAPARDQTFQSNCFNQTNFIMSPTISASDQRFESKFCNQTNFMEPTSLEALLNQTQQPVVWPASIASRTPDISTNIVSSSNTVGNGHGPIQLELSSHSVSQMPFNMGKDYTCFSAMPSASAYD